jgi:hypothetical protein
MRQFLIGSLLLLLTAASCAKETADPENAPQDAAPVGSWCPHRAEMLARGPGEWVNLEPDLYVEWNASPGETVSAQYSSAKMCDIIAIDFVYDPEKTRSWVRSAPELTSSNANQIELVGEVERSYLRRGDGEENLDQEARLRRFYVLNSAQPGTTDFTFVQANTVDYTYTKAVTIRIE